MAKKTRHPLERTKCSTSKPETVDDSTEQASQWRDEHLTGRDPLDKFDDGKKRTLNDNSTKYLDIPREWPTWPTWPPSGNFPYGHAAITVYNAASTLGMRPIDRWQQETSCQGPWNGVASAIEITNALDVKETAAGSEASDETDVGTWWP